LKKTGKNEKNQKNGFVIEKKRVNLGFEFNNRVLLALY
jgi:hypothetical protein